MFAPPQKRWSGHIPPEGNPFTSTKGARVSTRYSSCTDVRISGAPMPLCSTPTGSSMIGYGSISYRILSYSSPSMPDREYASDNSSRITKCPFSSSGYYKHSPALVLLLMRTLSHCLPHLGPLERPGGQSRGCGSRRTLHCMRTTGRGSG